MEEVMEKYIVSYWEKICLKREFGEKEEAERNLMPFGFM